MLGHGGLGVPNLAAVPSESAALPPASHFPDPGYESQVGVWHVSGRRGGRTGKRYRIYSRISALLAVLSLWSRATVLAYRP